MCGGGPCCCEEPREREVDPAQCTPEQIRECHGEVEEHPCCEPTHPCQGGECAGPDCGADPGKE
jgi:hypothetical protein